MTEETRKLQLLERPLANKEETAVSQRTRMLPQEAAAFIGCGYDKLMKDVRAGMIPHYRIGRRVFFTKETLNLWIDNLEMRSLQGKAQ
ncbi:MAG: excisionase family DNA-binding protein [Actinobacteria bacterium]|nr:excisionase family DNA-binding protein [Actinomycetota bacterium]